MNNDSNFCLLYVHSSMTYRGRVHLSIAYSLFSKLKVIFGYIPQDHLICWVSNIEAEHIVLSATAEYSTDKHLGSIMSLEMLTDLNISRQCADPLQSHQRKVKNLRYVTQELALKNPVWGLTTTHKLCRQCRDTLQSLPAPDEVNNSPSSSLKLGSPYNSQKLGSNTSSDSEDDVFLEDHELSVLNESLTIIGETPITKRKLEQNKFINNKIRKIDSKVKQKLQYLSPDNLDINREHTENQDFQEMMTQLKDKFSNTDKRSEKVKVLTLVPGSWSIRKTAEEFETTYFMARTAKQLVSEDGVLSDPNPKAGKIRTTETVEMVKNFYLSEEISRIMPGQKDFVSVVVDGKREHKQKHLVLCNLKEAFQLFKDKYPDAKIGFSKFADLWPKQCVLAGSAGTHFVCVCTIHQNIKLMMIGAKLEKFTDDTIPLKHYRDWHNFSAILPDENASWTNAKSVGIPLS